MAYNHVHISSQIISLRGRGGGGIKATYEIFLRKLNGKAYIEDLCVNL